MASTDLPAPFFLWGVVKACSEGQSQTRKSPTLQYESKICYFDIADIVKGGGLSS